MVAREGKKKKSFGEKLQDNWNGFSHFMYDKEKGEVMGRDCKSWAKIGLFYVVYYSCLAGFFAAMLAVFLHTLNDPGKGAPKLTQYLDKGPGLHTLFKINSFDPKKNTSYSKYTDAIDSYLQCTALSSQVLLSSYRTNAGKGTLLLKGVPFAPASQIVICPDGALDSSDYGITNCPLSDSGYSGNVPCRFDFSLLGPCSGKVDKTYGFANNTPCQFVMINRIYDWVPSNYGSNFLTLKCSVKSGDATVKTHPEGYLISAFPYKGQSFYKPPPVAVQILPKEKGEVRIRCYLSGKGIKTAEYFDATRAFANTDFKAQL